MRSWQSIAPCPPQAATHSLARYRALLEIWFRNSNVLPISILYSRRNWRDNRPKLEVGGGTTSGVLERAFPSLVQGNYATEGSSGMRTGLSKCYLLMETLPTEEQRN